MENSDFLLELVKLADELVAANMPKNWSEAPKAIVNQALKGMQLQEILVDGWSPRYVQGIMAQRVWQVLSEKTGQKVTIRLTVRSFL